jgi:hypothetical protein
MSTREPPRSRPFLMELLIVAALVWAGLQWARQEPEREDLTVAAATEPDPHATGSIRGRGRPSPGGEPDMASVKNLFGVLEILGRR